MKQEVTFIRYGGLSSYKQIHRKQKDSSNFHYPPKRKGLFAFPWPYVEFFLLGATSLPTHITGKTSWIKDKDGNRVVVEDEDYELVYKNGKECDIYSKRILDVLKYNKISKNNVWQVYLNPCENLECDDDLDCIGCPNDNKGKTYLSYLKPPRKFKYTGEIWSHLKEVVKPFEIIEEVGSWVKTDYVTYCKLLSRQKSYDLKELQKIGKPKNEIDPWKGPGLTTTRDHLEVFIEKI
jgi:hypothetical protein